MTQEQAETAEYALAAAQERERLTAIEEIGDPWTVERLEGLNLTEGWHCLEVGAGAGSIARWLSARVGPTGRVVATDIDTRFLVGLVGLNLDVLHHNIVTDPLPEDAFHLVHARAVLEHLPDHARALQNMAKALKTDGWLLAEDADYASWVPASGLTASEAALFSDISARFFKFLGMAGSDFFFARHLASLLRGQGFVDVEAEGRTLVVRGGSRAAQIWERAFASLENRLVGSGSLTADECQSFLGMLRNPAFDWLGPVMVSAWGRKP